MFAKLVAIEGPDKAGKFTQSELLTKRLQRSGYNVTLVEIPFNDHLTHKVIYAMLRNGSAKRFPNLFQFIQFLNKFIFQLTYLLWLRLFYDYVILDRWSLSAIVYGDATGVNKWFNRVLYSLLLRPNVTLILHGPSFKRNSVDDVYEKDSELQLAVRKGNYDWAQEHPVDHELIDNTGTRDDVHGRIMAVVEKL